MSFITKIKNKGDFCAEEEKIEILQNTAILSAFSIIKLRDKKKKKNPAEQPCLFSKCNTGSSAKFHSSLTPYEACIFFYNMESPAPSEKNTCFA